MDWLAYFQYVLCVWCVRYVYLVTFGHESAAEEGSYDKNYWYVENNNTCTVVAQKIRQSFLYKDKPAEPCPRKYFRLYRLDQTICGLVVVVRGKLPVRIFKHILILCRLTEEFQAIADFILLKCRVDRWRYGTAWDLLQDRDIRRYDSVLVLVLAGDRVEKALD